MARIVIVERRSKGHRPTIAQVVLGKGFFLEPIRPHRELDVRVEGKQLLHPAQTVPEHMPETVTTADFAAMFGEFGLAQANPKSDLRKRIVHDTRCGGRSSRGNAGKKHK